jgi:hypothetical protein
MEYGFSRLAPMTEIGAKQPTLNSPEQAGMGEKIAGVCEAAVSVEIVRRSGGRVPLHAWTDRRRDHVLLQSLIVADAGVAAQC